MSSQPPVQLSSEERNWAMFCHLSALSTFITGIGFILGPLICWLVKKDQMPFVDAHGKESINFQITCFIISLVIAVAGIITCGIGFFLYIPAVIAYVILIIMASIEASNGRYYKYPINIRFLT